MKDERLARFEFTTVLGLDAMLAKSIAVPILDSEDALWAPERVIEAYRRTEARIYLINVQPAYSSHISRFFSAKDLEQFHLENGRQILAPVGRRPDRAGVPHWDHVLIGRKLEQIVQFIEAHHCGELVLRDEPKSLLGRLGLASVNTQTRRALKTQFRQGW